MATKIEQTIESAILDAIKKAIPSKLNLKSLKDLEDTSSKSMGFSKWGGNKGMNPR